MKKTQSKIALHRETLRQLNSTQMQAAAGGYSQPPICPPPTVTCNVHNYTCSGPRCL
jgi:hypothetical protein